MSAALGFIAAWAAALALLAALWVRTPLSGPGTMFLAWSGPTFVLTALSASWLRRLRIRQVRVTRARMSLLGTGWVFAAAAALLLGDAAAEWALDGFILRRPPVRAAGIAVSWLPGLFGLGLCVAGLAAALEARYRIAHGQTGTLSSGDP